MAFPVVEEAIESSTNTAGTSHVVTLPTATAGQLLLIILDKGSTAATINSHASLTELLDENAANGLYIAYRWMDGTEPSSYTLTSSANTRSARIAYRISGAMNPAVDPPQIGTTGTGTSATPNPPASATPGSSKDYLFIAFAGMAGEEADDDTWGNTPPTNYTPSPPRQKSCGTAGVNLGGLIVAAERALTTGSAEDPGTFGVDVSAAWRSQTIMVHPSNPKTVTPGIATLAIATFAAVVTVSANVSVTPSPASLTLTGFAPSVVATDPKLVTPGTASLTLTRFAPVVTVSDHKTVTPGAASLTLTGFSPSVTASDHKTVTPGIATLTTTGFAPDVTASSGSGASVTPGTASLVLTTFAPSVTATGSEVQVSGSSGGPDREVIEEQWLETRAKAAKARYAHVHKIAPAGRSPAPPPPPLATGQSPAGAFVQTSGQVPVQETSGDVLTAASTSNKSDGLEAATSAVSTPDPDVTNTITDEELGVILAAMDE